MGCAAVFHVGVCAVAVIGELINEAIHWLLYQLALMCFNDNELKRYYSVKK